MMVQKSFSVDEFLHEHRNSGSLEIIRDDLGVYLKVLRSAMIELINEDYADFVNLASNLIGLDQSIEAINSPLTNLKSEITGVKDMLSNTIEEINEYVARKHSLRKQKLALQNLLKAKSSLKSLTHLVTQEQLLNCSEIKPYLLERAAFEMVQLRFSLTFCSEILTADQERETIHVHEFIMGKIALYFLDVLANKNTDGLERCLRIYCTLDECTSAEKIYKEKVVWKYFDPLLTESALQNNPQGLMGIYKLITKFVSHEMNDLLMLTVNGKLKGFDFFINSFWTEVERRLETYMSSIFAPGNPEQFYIKYRGTLDFLKDLENFIKTDTDRLKFRCHPQYKSFQTKWNLPVYFQIRFQEIGGHIESAFQKTINLQLYKTSGDFKLEPFAVALNAITKCWADGVYMEQLFHRFWKLTLQILGRLQKWTSDITKNLNNIPTDINKIEFMAFIISDYLTMVHKKIGIIEVDAIAKMPLSLQNKTNLLTMCTNETKEMFLNQISNFESLLLVEIKKKCEGHLKQINDIPRLYRKTNRDTPSKPSTYVEQYMHLPREYNDLYGQLIPSDRMRTFLIKLFSELTPQ